MMTAKRSRRARGFTLIEIMVVVVVLGILATFIVTAVAGKDEQARVSKARSDIATLVGLTENFRLDMRRYPTQDEGLDVLRTPPNSEDASLWRGPYARSPIPKDPWGQPYYYYSPAPSGDEFGIESYAADRQPGGEANNQDINSWTEYDEAGTAQ